MRKFVFVLLVLAGYSGNAQLGYEDFYSEKSLQVNLQKAKTTQAQMLALGRLVLHFKKLLKVSTRENERAEFFIQLKKTS